MNGDLTVNLRPTPVHHSESGIAFRALPNAGDMPPIPLWRDTATGLPDPRGYWELLQADGKRLTIEERTFHILRSRERICMPKGLAVYCRASDETIGEMRIHYAGFVHPLFGWSRQDGKKGTPLIFEVRGHDVNASLTHGEKLARLTFYRLSEDSAAQPVSPSGGGYNSQELNLSSFFAPWSNG